MFLQSDKLIAFKLLNYEVVALAPQSQWCLLVLTMYVNKWLKNIVIFQPVKWSYVLN